MPKTTDRTDYVINEIKIHQRELIKQSPDAMSVKFKKMSETPFKFYRGTAHLFYGDMKNYSSEFINEKTGRVWIQGDLHIGNFGTYMDNNHQIVYDVNDYDECYLAPFIWDVWRAAASIVLIVRQQRLKNAPEMDFVREYVKAYCEKIIQFGGDRSEKNFKINLENSQGEIKNILEIAYAAKRIDFLNQYTEIYRGVRRFKHTKHIRPLSLELRNQILSKFCEQYVLSIPLSHKHSPDCYSIQDIDLIEFKGAGIGSAGQKMLSFLIRGETDSPDDDVIIAAKIAKPSVITDYINPCPFSGKYNKDDAMRCINGQRAMQANSDSFLGHFKYDDKSFYTCELSPYEKSIDLDGVSLTKEFLCVLRQMGQATSKIHSISDKDADATLLPYSADEEIAKVISGKEERFINEACSFAVEYADIVENDFKAFLKPVFES